eukprot:CAMPEP_0168857834 /NCGR_PEP_ID=MMETSP0727-20121128/15959_1 /TAXON_ID=265536 /ORGANISM="Amphiprora sp., Strain CCMP467" /LENGTH=118 /DNA_ID=CAMNT_0008912525 /DNA_START=313 /DNA_END=666 /DNA_ORIENTATION=+
MPPVLRSLPPLSPRYPSPSGRTKVGSNANEVEDPAPQHLHPVSPLDGDVAETRDLDSEVVTAESCKQVWDEVLNSNSHYNNENSANGATSTTNTTVGNASDTGIELRNQSVSTTGRAL